MSVMVIDDEDDDYHSLSSVSNSDDDISECNDHTHRSCSRFQSCSKNNHQRCSINIPNSRSYNSNNSKPAKGDVRPVPNDPGHRQKFDGSRWRRICCAPNCCTFLNGGIYYDNWLCKKHLLALDNEVSYESDNSFILDKRSVSIRKSRSQRLSARQSNKITRHNKRGDIMVGADGLRQKYDGICWRPVCSTTNCKSFVVAHGLCHRHDTENRKKKSEVISTLNNIQPQRSTSILNNIQPSRSTSTLNNIQPPRSTSKLNNIQPQRSTSTSLTDLSQQSSKAKPRKGEIRSVRQQWNGTKWYSLCHYHTGECQRRSAGVKSAYLCEQHFREKNDKPKKQSSIDDDDFILLSPTIKRKKLAINIDNALSTNTMNQNNNGLLAKSFSSLPTSWKSAEQSIQTVVTYSVDSNDLKEGCILVDDDNDNNFQCDSPELIAYIKNEEEEYPSNEQNLPIDINSLPLNCKLELTELDEY